MNWVPGIHRAVVDCSSCRGRGFIRGQPCQHCHGAGRGEVGCGGPAERDLNHRTLANCIAEDRMIPPEEVT
jgi:hypothetical protein